VQQQYISLNADIGEGYGAWTIGDDDGLLAVLSDVNIACGFHAGDPSIMRRRVDAAVAGGLGIGAHVAYPDLRGFGRRHIDVPPAQVYDDTIYQLGALQAVCIAAGGRVDYVKPHGALYHDAWTSEQIADAVVRAMRDVDPGLALLCPAGSAMARVAAAAGTRAVQEGYIDRGYLPDGHLVPRSQPGALIGDPEAAARRVLGVLTDGTVTAIDGTVVPLPVESLCVHSDSPGAAALARAVRNALEDHGVGVRPFGRG
jgi:5-oxoprolinase (ATP-hydrolysing) subunit A